MRDSAPQPVYLKDYTPFPWRITAVSLTFALDPQATRVRSSIEFAPDADAPNGPFFLHGENLKLITAAIDGQPVSPSFTDAGLTCDVPDGPFTWEAEVEIAPEENTALEGLYMSKGMYCTQCEAEGFRKITYYPDRPDVMAPFNVRIEGDAPVLLSNGNPGTSGPGWSEWHDPWPKPAYLFALVAGDLQAHSDSFTTASGKSVALNIWVRDGDQNKCDYAMGALKRSMRWDEEVYGREYDLDVFNIVAVDDFNMGAMENKGLNIFNSKYVLASPKTATDRDYELIEGIVAHEYFHNWTGNRITCRDWFQLCLKEGLTVYRDQQFSGDMRSHAVKRIDDVLLLRGRQFREDAGPLAHPVRPSSYIEINNFYTATVYEKGAEVIGMLRTLVGPEGYQKALNLYFDRHDGDAATIEDFRKCFEDACGLDLTQFARWWEDPGTPRVTVEENWANDTLTLKLRQSTKAAGRTDFMPRVIPLCAALIGPDGSELMEPTVLTLTEADETVQIRDLPQRPTLSINRGFSAPVIIERKSSTEERAFLLANDTDPFNRWEAGRALAKDVLIEMVTGGAQPGPAYLDALNQMAQDDRLDPSFRALALGIPSDDDLAQSLHDGGITPDPSRIYAARKTLRLKVAEHLKSTLGDIYAAMDRPGPYTPDAGAAGCRALRLRALGYLSLVDDGKRAARQFETADNMTEQLGALAALIDIGSADDALAAFARQWDHDRLVMDKWFALQVSGAAPADAAAVAEQLTQHRLFDWKNPNRFRSVIGALSANSAGFHDPSGASYRLMTDWLLKLDAVNPQTTARMTTAFETWRRYDADRQGMIRENLERLAAKPGLSRDVTEMVNRILGA
ncbi:MAG: aminopeptidase N [Pseudomonadota bacterium]